MVHGLSLEEGLPAVCGLSLLFLPPSSRTLDAALLFSLRSLHFVPSSLIALTFCPLPGNVPPRWGLTPVPWPRRKESLMCGHRGL